MKRIAIFASGSGSNAEEIIHHFKQSNSISVVKVYTNRKNAGVIDRCMRLNIPYSVFNKKAFLETDELLVEVKSEADYIVLAGFLLKIPETFIQAFPNKIINIHPALLPKYGGKGMYGMHVHQAVKENKDSETGITIHFVNEHYDEGAIIFQASTKIDSKDTPDEIAQKVHQLEHQYFPQIIEDVIVKNG